MADSSGVSGTQPPKRAEAILSRLLPERDRGPILGDLAQEYAAIARSHGVEAARSWYWHQLTLSVLPAMRRRLGRRHGRGSKGTLHERNPGSGLGVSWLDVKLGLRMLVKQPALNLVVVCALAIGIPIGLYPDHLVRLLEAPLPVSEGDRIQVLRYYDVENSRAGLPTLDDFAHWRDEMTTFQAIAATTLGNSYNVISDVGGAAPVLGAEVTASMFDILRIGPELGRTLIPADEVASGADVVVIGYDLWQARLAGDPEVVGRVIRVGGVLRTVVGVMPQDFYYPYRDQLWLPLRLGEVTLAQGRQRTHVVFGRLSDGVSAEEAETELVTVAGRTGSGDSESMARLQPQVVGFMTGLIGEDKAGMRANPEFFMMKSLAMLVLIIACGNVGMLIFARTAARTSELAMRTALGASRTRIIAQLFTEALVFAVLAAGIGLGVGDLVVVNSIGALTELMPYWLDVGVTVRTVIWGLSLAVFSAAVVGVVPALKATGKSVHRNIQRAQSGRSGLRFGGVSSVLIAADVAFAVASVGAAVVLSSALTDVEDTMGTLPEQFLSAELIIPPSPVAEDNTPARIAVIQEEVIRRLEAEPGIRGVTMASLLPGMDHRGQRIVLDEEPIGQDVRAHRVAVARVDPAFFGTFEQPILAGRGFDSGDLGEDRSAVIVNAHFVEHVLEGRNPIGRRLRYATRGEEAPGPWYEVVGVVETLGTIITNTDPAMYQAVYHALALGETPSLYLGIHVGDDPESFAPRLRTLTSEVHTAAMISNPVRLSDVVSFTRMGTMIMVLVSGTLIGIMIALSISGTYALMSFTVSERTREIGIRTALGAHRISIGFTVAKRAIAQLAVGILIGMPVAWVFFEETQPSEIPTQSPYLLTVLVGGGLMILIGVLACTAPTLRALRIEPTEALREGV